MVFRWREDHTPLVLGLLRTHECLWNTRNIDYRNNAARERALLAVAEGLCLPVTPEDIKLKIKTIRTRYSSELAKVQASENSATSPEGIYVPKLSWFHLADTFLRAVCVPRSNACRASFKVNHPKESVYVQIHEDESYENTHANESITTTDEGEFEFEEMSDSKEAIQREILSQNGIGLESGARGVKRSPGDEDYHINMDLKSRKLSGQLPINDSETEFDLFCKSLAVQLNKMPVQRALICQQQLQQVMTNERLFQLSNP